jgi:hypothetical protein
MVAVVIWEDRHVDIQPFVFTETADAIEWARDRAREHTMCEGFEEFIDPDHEDGIVYAVTYCIEGDRISVTECEIDAEVA